MISKRKPPTELVKWKTKNPGRSYQSIPAELRQAIRRKCLQEQYWICCYCCRRIDINSAHNEHLIPQSVCQKMSTEFNNIMASCNSNQQCGNAHGNHVLSLTPLMKECESELRFLLSGKVEGLTVRAKELIGILNLGDTRRNNRKLIETRKAMVDALIYQKGSEPDELYLLDKDLLELLIDELRSVHNGEMEPYAPVLVNILSLLRQNVFSD
jgi:uncharacterized protein (TIGR02646 family)